jgi:hypothetical protein
MTKLQTELETALVHAKRMGSAKATIDKLFPIGQKELQTLSDTQIMCIDSYNNRFAQLQDLLGAKIFPELLKANGEQIDEMFYIDRINKLEQLRVIINAAEWMEMRRLRNNLLHEYPDKPELLADNLNKAFAMGPELISCLNRAIEFAKRIGVMQ